MGATPSRRSEIKNGLNKAKSYEDAWKVFGMEWIGEEASREGLEKLLPKWRERKEEEEKKGLAEC